MKFNKNEFGWKEKVNINTDELVTKNDIPHYNETLITEISGDDYSSFMNNEYFNMSALNLDETKSYIGKEMSSNEKYSHKFVYDKEADALICEDTLVNIYNHKSYNGTNFTDDENSAVLTLGITTFGLIFDGYFRLYEIDKVELDNNCLSDNVRILNSLTVGNRIGETGQYSVAEGYQNAASGAGSHAEGSYTTASGTNSHAEGSSSDSATIIIQNLSSSTSDDDILTAWNNTNGFSLAKGESSHVEGKDCLALGDNSHAEGNYAIAIGVASHVEGMTSRAKGGASHAEGNSTKADGMCSHAEGNKTTASGDTSHAEGDGTKASSKNQHVQGKYNIEDTANKYAHIVGNGTYNYNTEEEVRSNAHTLDWNGNGWYAGKLSQDGTPTEDKDLTTKKYVDDTIANQPQLSFDTEGNLVVTIGGVTKKFKEITE